MKLILISVIYKTTSGGIFWGVFEFNMILSSLSDNGWVCILALLIVWNEAISTGACWSLGGTVSLC